MNINLYPPIVVENLLMCPINTKIYNQVPKDSTLIHKGDSILVPYVDSKETVMVSYHRSYATSFSVIFKDDT